MRIVLDLQGAQCESRLRGIGRYTMSLAQSIVRQADGHEVILALGDLYPNTIEPIRAAFDGLLPQGSIRVWQSAGPVGASSPGNDWRRAAARRIREAFLESLDPDIVHVSHPLPGLGQDVVVSVGTFTSSFATVFTLHDLIPLMNPATYLAPYPRFEEFYRESLTHLKRADGWLAVSDSSAREAQEQLGLNPEKIANVSEGSDAIFRPARISATDARQFLARYGVVRPYVMYSGGSDPRKNLHRLIQAYSRLPQQVRGRHQLVLVGDIPAENIVPLQATARDAKLRPDDLLFTGFVPDADLVLLYSLARLVVLPSLHEGFGLPALEAMACGTPVIGANLTSIPEVIGWRDALFDPLDIESMSATIGRALVDVEFRAQLLLHEKAQATRFSWDETGRAAIRAFERLQRHGAARRLPVASPTDVTPLVHDLRIVPGNPDNEDIVRTARAIAWNHPAHGGRRLLVDVSEFVRGDARTGIQRVVQGVVASLPKVAPSLDVELVFATRDRRGYRHAVRTDREAGPVHVTTTNEVVDFRPSDIFLGLDLRPDVVVAQSDVLAELGRLGVPVHFVVYDLLPVLMPHRFPAEAGRRHERWLHVVASADSAICISRSVAHELQSWVAVNTPNRLRPLAIDWFHPGTDLEQPPSTAAIQTDAASNPLEISSRPSFLVVGTLEPRKGHVQTLDAFDLLWAQQMDLDLVFVGKQGWKIDPFVRRLRRHHEFGRRLQWLPEITDDYLRELYRASTCLIAPSEGEGFGLPLIEAARHGTPIIARDLPVHHEVAGDHAFYFRGFAPLDLATAAVDWLALWRGGRHPRSDGIPVQTWDQSTSRLLEIVLRDQAGQAVPAVAIRS